MVEAPRFVVAPVPFCVAVVAPAGADGLDAPPKREPLAGAAVVVAVEVGAAVVVRAPVFCAALVLGAKRLGTGLAGSDVGVLPTGLLTPAKRGLADAELVVAALVDELSAGLLRFAKGELDGAEVEVVTAEVPAGASEEFFLSVDVVAAVFAPPKRDPEGFAADVSVGFADCPKRGALAVAGAALVPGALEGFAPNKLPDVELSAGFPNRLAVDFEAWLLPANSDVEAGVDAEAEG